VVEEDEAEVIVMCCALESGFADEMSRALGVRVLDPVVTSWEFVEMQADTYSSLGIPHSKAYCNESPPKEEGWLYDGSYSSTNAQKTTQGLPFRFSTKCLDPLGL
jgi:hypothetical protein